MTALPVIRKARCVQGRTLLLRDACEADAPFIHALRSDPVRARHLSAVPPQVQAQADWLRRYAGSQGQAYFVIADGQSGAPLGTVRLYDARGTAFCWGSWQRMNALADTLGL